MNQESTEGKLRWATQRKLPPEISVVVPFYNEGPNVRALLARLIPVLQKTGETWEIVCVNDGSRDNTLDLLIDASDAHPGVKVIDLSRNFGKDLALSAGLAYASGRAVIPIDADLQHPPEVILELLAKWREGYEMVYAVRRSRDDQSTGGRLFARTFYWLFKKFSEVNLPEGAGDFRLLDRKVVDALNRMPERNRFMKGIFAWVGFKQIGVPYDVEERAHGTSKFSAMSLIKFALSGLAAFSNLPLRIWGIVGASISLLAFAYIAVRLVRAAIVGIDVPGYESIIVTILFLGGIQLISLGVLGEYLGRVFDEVKGRPLYVVREEYGFAEADQSAPVELVSNERTLRIAR
jgi:glycosyltransferase involved in cell wall biosynthesis